MSAERNSSKGNKSCFPFQRSFRQVAKEIQFLRSFSKNKALSDKDKDVEENNAEFEEKYDSSDNDEVIPSDSLQEAVEENFESYKLKERRLKMRNCVRSISQDVSERLKHRALVKQASGDLYGASETADGNEIDIFTTQ